MELEEAIKMLAKKSEYIRKDLEEGKYYGERFYLEQEANAIDIVLKELNKLKLLSEKQDRIIELLRSTKDIKFI